MKAFIIVESSMLYCNGLPEMYVLHNSWLGEKTDVSELFKLKQPKLIK